MLNALAHEFDLLENELCAINAEIEYAQFFDNTVLNTPWALDEAFKRRDKVKNRLYFVEQLIHEYRQDNV